MSDLGLPVIVKFPEGVPDLAQAEALMIFEKALRRLTGLDVRVLKDRMGDDSKLRVKMTPEERERI